MRVCVYSHANISTRVGIYVLYQSQIICRLKFLQYLRIHPCIHPWIYGCIDPSSIYRSIGLPSTDRSVLHLLIDRFHVLIDLSVFHLRSSIYWSMYLSMYRSTIVCTCVCMNVSIYPSTYLHWSTIVCTCVCMNVSIYPSTYLSQSIYRSTLVRACICMHVFMHVRVHVCIYVYIYVCMWVCVFVGVYVCMNVRMYIRTYAHLCVYMYIYMYQRMHVSIYVCIHVCMHVCTYAYQSTYEYIEISTSAWICISPATNVIDATHEINMVNFITTGYVYAYMYAHDIPIYAYTDTST